VAPGGGALAGGGAGRGGRPPPPRAGIKRVSLARGGGVVGHSIFQAREFPDALCTVVPSDSEWKEVYVAILP